MKTIMQDIARLAGVSPGTVSNALNNRKGVGKQTKDKIIKIANDLGYYKNSSKAEAKIIRFIIYKKHGFVVSDTPFFAALIQEIENECRNNGYELLISHVSHDDDIELIIKQERVSGVLVLATEMREMDLEQFENLNIPVIFLDNCFNNSNFDYVLMDNINGTYQATKYLIQNGHRKIGFIGGSKLKTINNFEYRYEGFKKALAEANLEVNGEYNIMLEPTIEGAYKDMKEILKNNTLKFATAYLAGNDIIAFGAMKAFKEYGIKIPDDVSIIGFDDMPFCQITSPKLTTVRVYIDYIGKMAVKRLVQKLSEQDVETIKIEINNKLIERESVKKL